MLERATIHIDTARIAANTRTLVDALPGIDIVGVTKVTCGAPEVARAMLEGGAVAIGESRLENIERLRAAGIEAPFWLLRSPVPAQAEQTVRLADVSLVSEIATLEALSSAGVAANRAHGIIAMIDLGDLREGMLSESLPAFVTSACAAPGVELVGLGTSLTCYGAVIPSEENLGELVALAEAAAESVGRSMTVSGGMSSSLELALAGRMPEGVDNLRVGESILLGVSTITRLPLPGLHTDAFVLEAPVIECATKPSAPIGEIAQDAFGGSPSFVDKGLRRRALLGIGRQDVDPAGLRPLAAGVEVLGASSDHLVVDVHEMAEPPQVGDTLTFVPNYSATLRLFTSPYVEKRWGGRD